MIVVIGEALIDIVIDADGDVHETPGGSPLNVAVGLGRLGIDTELITQLGNDERADLILDHLRNSDVRVTAAPTHSGKTPTATAHLDADGRASYTFDLEWSLSEQDLPRCDAVHIGSLGTILQPGRESVLELVDEAIDYGHLLSYDINVREAFLADAEATWRDVVALASQCSLVKLSDEDAALLQPGLDPVELCRELLAGERTSVVVLTQGAEGATAVGEGFEISARPRAAEVVDTVGAGDAFTAGLLAMLEEAGHLDHDRLPTDEDVWRALLAGSVEIATLTCERRGANPPTRKEVSESFARVRKS